MSTATDHVLDATLNWLERAVIGLNLCPFASAVHKRQQIRWVRSKASTEQELRADLADELDRLARTDETSIETTLLIHPAVLNDFLDYNRFLGSAERMLARAGLQGILQIASFHPDYCFADTGSDEMSNFSNRSPFPMLHLLREASVARAVQAHPDTAGIYRRNIELLERLGRDGWDRLWD
jgi:uncharacterized protein